MGDSAQHADSVDSRYKSTAASSLSNSKANSFIDTPVTPAMTRSTSPEKKEPANMDTTEPTIQISKPQRDWRAYRAIVGGFLLMFNSWGLVNAFGTFATYYVQWILPGQDNLKINLIGALNSFVVLLFSPVIGRLLDAGYGLPIKITGTVLTSLSYFTLSVINLQDPEPRLYMLIVITQGLLGGLGMTCFFVTSSQVVATWFPTRRSLVIGIGASGASIAGLIYPVMFREIVRASGDFNFAVKMVATLITLTSIMATYCATPNPAHPKNHALMERKRDWMAPHFYIDFNALRELPFALLVVAIAFMFLGFYAIFFNLEEWSVSEGFGFRALNAVGANAGLPSEPASYQIHTYYLLMIMNAVSTIGRVGAGYTCDKLGALNVHAFVMAVSSLLCLILWSLAHTLASALAFAILFGIFSGAVIGLPPASVAYVLGPNPERQKKLGQWTGTMYFMAAIPALVGPVIAGHLISHYKTFLTVQMWSGACLALSTCSMLAAIYFKRRERGGDVALRANASRSTSQGMLDVEKQET